MKIALAQINPTIGDFEYNLQKILDFTDLAIKQKAKLIIFPELSICGYPAKDLLLKKQFVEDSFKYLNLLKEKVSPDIVLIVGFPEANSGQGRPLFDSVAVIYSGKIILTRQKTLLPTYDVFDEDRYFEPAKSNLPIELLGKKIGLTICEDIWHDDLSWVAPRYHGDPVDNLAILGIDLLINSSSSPYFLGKPKLRETVLKNCAKKYKLPIIYVNQTGGNDELIFDGNSCVVNTSGEVILRLKSFEEDLGFIDLETINKNSQIAKSEIIPEEELLQASILGIRDYVRKCGFKKVLLGLSGGIDSALTAVLATYAVGKENVQCVFMPSRFTSTESKIDSEKLVSNLAVEFKTISIEEPFTVFTSILSNIFDSQSLNKTQTLENVQSRIRGLILMSLSNQTGALVLSTGNKSELATGYCTLYGDMCGGLAVISDLPKTLIYKLSEYINHKEGKEIIPNNILTKAPTAELKPNQKDQDIRPPYDVLDKVLNMYVEQHLPVKEIIKNNISVDTVIKTCNMIDYSEYKRQQAAPGLKLTSRSFGYGWRMPIAQRYREQI